MACFVAGVSAAATKKPAKSKSGTSSTVTASQSKSSKGKSVTGKSSKGKTSGKKASSSKRKSSQSSRSRRTSQKQMAPTPERYREIQQALSDKGYYKGPVDGIWNAECVNSLKRFQEDQNLNPDGKLGALSLIALGLGPKRTPISQQFAVKPETLQP